MNRVFDFLDQHRVADELRAEAYEQAGAQLRGLFKQNIADQHRLLEQRLPCAAHTREVVYGSEACARTSRPAPWCLILHDAGYASAPRALAAAVPAILAGVENIWAVALHDKHKVIMPAPQLLAAWELAGVENTAAALDKELLPLLLDILTSDTFDRQQGPGRILILGSPVWDKIVCAALTGENQALLRREGRPPHILLTGEDSRRQQNIAQLLHPDAELFADRQFASLNKPDVCYNAVFFNAQERDRALNIPASLHLDYTHAGTWIWPELHHEFFLNHGTAFYSLSDK